MNTDFLARAARSRPDAPALVFGGGAWSYAELDAAASRVAAAVAAAGIDGGDRVSVWATNDPDAVAALWGIPRAGAVAVPIGTGTPAAAARKLVAAAGAKAIVPAAGTPDLGLPALPTANDGPASIELATTGPAYVVFTSGSSGSAKGVILTRENIAAAVTASRARLGNGPGDAWLAVLPLHHVGGLSILWRSAEAGGTVVLEERFDPATVAATLRSGEATFVSLVPTMLNRVLDADPGPYAGVRCVLLGGGPIPDGLVARAAAAGLPVAVTYGMTETASQVATAVPGSDQDAGLEPLDGLDVRVVGSDGEALATGEEGTIRLRGTMVTPGYLGDPPRARGDWFTTGDRGALDAAGRLRVTGRADDVIVTGGENVHSAEVEAVLRSHLSVRDVAVFGIDDAEWGRAVAAAVVTDGEVTEAELAVFVKERLAGFKAPRTWRFVDNIPRTELGKVDRARLDDAS